MIHAGPANFLRLAFGRPEPEFRRRRQCCRPAWLGLYFLPEGGVGRAAIPTGARGTPASFRRARCRAGCSPASVYASTLRAHRRDRAARDAAGRHLGEAGRAPARSCSPRSPAASLGPSGLALEGRAPAQCSREEVKAGERNQAPRRDCAAERRALAAPASRPIPVLLFRFSALTFNSHRIHYDRAWAHAGRGLSRSRRPRPADDDRCSSTSRAIRIRASGSRPTRPGASAAVRHRAVRARGRPATARSGLRPLGRHARRHHRDERRGRSRPSRA